MRKIALALVIAAVATPTLAQGVGPNISADSFKFKTDEEVKQEEEREAGYKAGLSKIPDAKAKKQDPWGGVRNDSAQNHAKPHQK